MKRWVSVLLVSTLITAPNLFAGVPLAPASGPQQNFQSTSPVSSDGVRSQAAFIDHVRGLVTLKKAQERTFVPVTGRTQVGTGDTITTEAGTCELLMENKTGMTLSPKSTLTLTELTFDVQNGSKTSRFKMDKGRLKASIGKLSKGSRFEVVTPTAIAAVRGTLLYLNAGVGEDNQQFTELFVDDSAKGVLFTNSKTGNEFLVQENHSSSALEDGSLAAPKKLTEQEQQELVRSWEQQLVQDVVQQGGVEEEVVSSQTGAADEVGTDDLNAGRELFEDSGVVDSEKAIDRAARVDVTLAKEPAGTDQEREAFRLGLRRELDLIQTDTDFDRSIAHFEKMVDAQTGKVMTDIHGNRIRTDQYIFKPTDKTVEFLSLTYRAGGALAGISSLAFQVDFNSVIRRDLKELPWNDYMNVVSQKQLGDLGVEEFLPNNEDRDESDFNQFIAHQGPQETTGEGGEERLSLYPVSFKASFRNPALDSVVFSEQYGEAFKVTFHSDEDESITPLWVQAKIGDSTLILPHDGDSVEMLSKVGSPNELKINGLAVKGWVIRSDSDGAQSEGFSDDVVNHGFDSTLTRYNHVIHPAYFENRFLVISEEEVISAEDINLDDYDFQVLRGVFVPVDDAGAPVGQPGFALRGVRDLLRPNDTVSDGRYNLEALFSYGSINLETGQYTETFRIDTLIAPEILEPYRLVGELRDDGFFSSNRENAVDSDNPWSDHNFSLEE